MLTPLHTHTHFTHLTQLECIRRTGETEWVTDVVLPSVSFAELVLPSKEVVKKMEALELRKIFFFQ